LGSFQPSGLGERFGWARDPGQKIATDGELSACPAHGSGEGRFVARNLLGLFGSCFDGARIVLWTEQPPLSCHQKPCRCGDTFGKHDTGFRTPSRRGRTNQVPRIAGRSSLRVHVRLRPAALVGSRQHHVPYHVRGLGTLRPSNGRSRPCPPRREPVDVRRGLIPRRSVDRRKRATDLLGRSLVFDRIDLARRTFLDWKITRPTSLERHRRAGLCRPRARGAEPERPNIRPGSLATSQTRSRADWPRSSA